MTIWLKSPFLLLLSANLLVFYPAINSTLFWDDSILFQGSLLSEAKHPLVYWLINGPFYKTWPLFYSVLKVMYEFLGHHYWAYKFCSILLHTINATILFSLLSRSLSKKKSLAIALLFSLHPFQVETVLWIFQLNTSLATFFLLLAAWFYPKGGRWYFISVLAFFFSLNSKVLAAAFPLFLIFYLFKKRVKWRQLILQSLPFVLLSCTYSSLSYQGTFYYSSERYHRAIVNQSPATQQPNKSTTKIGQTLKYTAQKTLVPLQNLAFYAHKALLPYPIMYLYPPPKLLSLSGLFLLGIVLLYFIFRRRQPALDYFFLIWLTAFIPVSGIFHIGFFKFSFVSNRYMYVGVIGIMGLLALLIPFKKWLYPPIILTLAMISWNTSHLFARPLALYESNYRHNPKNPYLPILLGNHYLKLGELSKVILSIERVVENPHAPYFPYFLSLVEHTYHLGKDRWLTISKWHLNLGQRKQAIKQLKIGLTFFPENKQLTEALQSIQD